MDTVIVPHTIPSIAAGLHTITPYRERLRQMLHNRTWLAANIQALCQQYTDQWVVIADQAVKGAGPTPEAATAASGPVDESVALILMLPRRIPQPI